MSRTGSSVTVIVCCKMDANLEPLYNHPIALQLTMVWLNTNTEEEICRKMYKIQTNSTGFVEIPTTSSRSSRFLQTGKTTLITPISEQTNPLHPKGFRPISVLPAIWKISEHLDIPNENMAAGWIQERTQFYDHGSDKCYDHCTVVVLVDFSLTFNCVNHQNLETKLWDEFQLSREICHLRDPASAPCFLFCYSTPSISQSLGVPEVQVPSIDICRRTPSLRIWPSKLSTKFTPQ